MSRSRKMIASTVIMMVIFTLFLTEQAIVNAAFAMRFAPNVEESCCPVVVNGGFESDEAWRFPIAVWSGGYDSSTAHSEERSARLGIPPTTKRVPNRRSYSTVLAAKPHKSPQLAWQKTSCPVNFYGECLCKASCYGSWQAERN